MLVAVLLFWGDFELALSPLEAHKSNDAVPGLVDPFRVGKDQPLPGQDRMGLGEIVEVIDGNGFP